MSTFPNRYREVSVTDVDVPLDEESLRALLTSRPVYRRSRYLVARRGTETALVELVRGETTGLFSTVDDIVLLAPPEQVAYLHRPDLDTGVPSDLIRAALEVPSARCVVVQGAYGHVSFVLDPKPIPLHVLDVAPPWPAKLLHQVQRLLETADDLPGVVTVPHVVDLSDLLPGEPAGHYLLPCRGGGMDVPGAEVSYLDEVPPRADWTLLGCARSRAIHDFFYGGDVPQVDTCPRAIAAGIGLPPGEVLLTKCCLLENHIEIEGRIVVTPWGASFAHLGEALISAVRVSEES